MAVSVVREKELGSITNFYTTPSKRLDFLLGKQLPYVAIGMLNYLILVAMSIVVFGVPLKGSGLTLTLCALLYVIATTGFGLLISTFTSSQVAAVFITAILTILPTTQFSGMLQPVSTLDGAVRCGGDDLAHDLLHARQRRRVHERARPGSADGRRLGFGHIHSRVHALGGRGAQAAGGMSMRRAANIFWLGMKELRSLQRDFILMIFVVYSFTLAIYTQAKGTSSEVNNASIAFVDEDHSALSQRLIDAFYPPRFRKPEIIRPSDIDPAMEKGRYMFVVAIPPKYESDSRADRHPEVQVNIDATAMLQASIGALYIERIISSEVLSFLESIGSITFGARQACDCAKEFNPNGDASWFYSIVAIINQITMLTIILTGSSAASRARAWHHRAPTGDAPNRFRGCHGQGLGQWIGDFDRGDRLAVFRGSGDLGCTHRRVAAALFGGRRVVPVLRHRAGRFFRNHYENDGPVRAIDHPADHRVANALGRKHAHRKPARMAPTIHTLPAIASFRQLFAGDHLSRCGPGDGLARVFSRGGYGASILQFQSEPIPPLDCGHTMSGELDSWHCNVAAPDTAARTVRGRFPYGIGSPMTLPCKSFGPVTGFTRAGARSGRPKARSASISPDGKSVVKMCAHPSVPVLAGRVADHPACRRGFESNGPAEPTRRSANRPGCCG